MERGRGKEIRERGMEEQRGSVSNPNIVAKAKRLYCRHSGKLGGKRWCSEHRIKN